MSTSASPTPAATSWLTSSPSPARCRPRPRESLVILRQLIARIGEYGLLRMSVKRATEVMHGAAVGYVLSQIRVTPEERDPQLSEIVRESTLARDCDRRPAASGPFGPFRTCRRVARVVAE